MATQHSVYAAAAQVKTTVDALALTVADKFNGVVATAPLKGIQRATEKVAKDYNGDWGKIKDIVRNTIIVSMADYEEGQEDLSEE